MNTPGETGNGESICAKSKINSKENAKGFGTLFMALVATFGLGVSLIILMFITQELDRSKKRELEKTRRESLCIELKGADQWHFSDQTIDRIQEAGDSIFGAFSEGSIATRNPINHGFENDHLYVPKMKLIQNVIQRAEKRSEKIREGNGKRGGEEVVNYLEYLSINEPLLLEQAINAFLFNIIKKNDIHSQFDELSVSWTQWASMRGFFDQINELQGISEEKKEEELMKVEQRKNKIIADIEASYEETADPRLKKRKKQSTTEKTVPEQQKEKEKEKESKEPQLTPQQEVLLDSLKTELKNDRRTKELHNLIQEKVKIRLKQEQKMRQQLIQAESNTSRQKAIAQKERDHRLAKTHQQAKEEYKDAAKKAFYQYFGPKEATGVQQFTELEELMIAVNQIHTRYEQEINQLDRAITQKKKEITTTTEEEIDRILGKEKHKRTNELTDWYDTQQTGIRKAVAELEKKK